MPQDANDKRLTINHQIILKLCNLTQGMISQDAMQAALGALSFATED